MCNHIYVVKEESSYVMIRAKCGCVGFGRDCALNLEVGFGEFYHCCRRNYETTMCYSCTMDEEAKQTPRWSVAWE
jgi:hypothetical protein